MTETITLGTAIKRGIFQKCPKCGEGKLFSSYLKQVDECDVCHEHYGHIRADDGPSWLTILLIGHIIIPFLIITQMTGALTPTQGAILWLSVATILIFVLLPITKGFFISMLWKTKAPGSERI